MAKNKHDKQPSKRGGPRGRANNYRTRASPRSNWTTSTTSETTSTFSLRDAAFYTERKYPISQSSTQLRYKTINFVSAGSEAPLSRVEEDDKHTPTTSLQTEAQDEGQFQDVPSEEFASMSLHPGAKGTDDATAQVGNAEDLTPQPLFVEDKVGTAEKPFTGLPDPELRSSSPVSSDSSEEVIVFRGRNPQKPISNDQRPENSTGPRQSSDSFPQGVQDPTSGPKVPTQAIVCAQSISPEPEQPSWDNTPGNWGHQGERRTRREQKMTGGIEAAMDSAFLSRPSNSKETRRLQNRELRLLKENEESFDDYISNLIENGEDDVFHEGVQSGTRNLPLDDGQDGFAGAEATVIRREQDQRPNQDEGWGSAELDDYDNMSTSDDTFNIVSLILRKRERPSGTQYLVVHRGDTIDDAKWRPGHTITSESELEVVTKFEEENNMEWEDDDESDDDQDDDAEIDDYDLENESEIDELDLVERMKDRMTDEHIARILSKQEELGIGSDDIVLFDGIEEGEDDEFGTYTYGRGYSSSARGPTRAKGKNSRKKGYPMEEQPYGDFDIMDRDRPGLRPVSGRGPPVAYGVSDEELRAVMQSTWAADREKKKIRKQEREELRAQGLLGGGNKKADLSTRYSQGIGAQQILDEIRAFLGSSHESQPFPPMKKNDRKHLHSIASTFHLKSKSVGSGKSRYPVLYKTSRTVAFDDDAAFARAESFLTRQFLPRMDRKAKGAAPRRGGRASYKDGDVVGLSAPELGPENKGTAMLEKMGWSRGMALGSADNKGILQPIEHVVKNSKLGLG